MSEARRRPTRLELWERAQHIAANSYQCTMTLSGCAGEFCILGVFCEAYRQLTGKGRWKLEDALGERIFEFEGHVYSDKAPPELLDAFGFDRHPEFADRLMYENDEKSVPLTDLIKMGRKMVCMEEDR